MKNLSESKVIEFLGNQYRCTKHAGSGVIEIEKLVPRWWRDEYKWKLIYFGHPQPIMEIAKYCEVFPHPTEEV